MELEKLKLMGNEPATLYDFAVLDAVWSGIVQSPEAIQKFLLADGLGSLLDLLDRGAAALQPLLLTVIAGTLTLGFTASGQRSDLIIQQGCCCLLYARLCYSVVEQTTFLRFGSQHSMV